MNIVPDNDVVPTAPVSLVTHARSVRCSARNREEVAEVLKRASEQKAKFEERLEEQQVPPPAPETGVPSWPCPRRNMSGTFGTPLVPDQRHNLHTSYVLEQLDALEQLC